MKKKLLPVSRISFFFILAFCVSYNSPAQQNIIADKDNTHPQADLLAARPAMITGFSVREENNCNEISWTAAREEEVRKYIIEYSVNGSDYQTAGEMIASNKPYLLRHYYNYERPLLYRLRTEQLNGKNFYSVPLLVGFPSGSPVQIYPTIINGNIVNINAALPVEQVQVVSGSGTQVFSKAIGGKKDYISVAIPSLSSGVYFMVFYGNGWKRTEKFIVQ